LKIENKFNTLYNLQIFTDMTWTVKRYKVLVHGVDIKFYYMGSKYQITGHM